MIGPKKLSTVREELRGVLAATGDDPIGWLEVRMTNPERQASGASGASEVLHSLRRLVEATARIRRRGKRSGTKK
jgi:hypothetical protein